VEGREVFDSGSAQLINVMDKEDAMPVQLLGLLRAHIRRKCHGNKTVSMMHLHNARERLSGIADLCQVLRSRVYLEFEPKNSTLCFSR
jgi:hypothetical protein